MSPSPHPDAHEARAAVGASPWERLLPALFVLLVWVVATREAWTYVDLFASAIPLQDDMEIPVFLEGDGLDWEQLWSPANEHRIPLPRLVYLGLWHLTSDFRSAMYFQVVVQSLLALGMALLVRRLRGRTSYLDAFFPLFWLHIGNAENFLLGMQITIAVPTALTCGTLALLAWRPGPPTRLAATLATLCLLVQPTCGGFGLTQVPPLATWMLAAGFAARRSDAAGARRVAPWLLGGGALAWLAVAIYFVGYAAPSNSHKTHELGRALGITAQVLGLNLGPVAAERPAAAIAVTLALLALAVAVLVRATRRGGGESWRASAILAVLGAPVLTALAIGWGRQDAWPVAGLANRYVTLPSPLFAGIFVAFCLYGGPALVRGVRFLLFAAMLGLFWYNHEYGRSYGERRRQIIATFYEEVVDGRSDLYLATRYGRTFYANTSGFLQRLRLLRRLRLPPYDVPETARRTVSAGDDPLELLGRRPDRVEAPEEPLVRIVAETVVVGLPAGSALAYDLPEGARAVSAVHGVLPTAFRALAEEDATRGLVFEIVLAAPDGARTVLAARTLRPVEEAEDRGPQRLEVAIPDGSVGELRLEIRRATEAASIYDWGYWRDVGIEVAEGR